LALRRPTRLTWAVSLAAALVALAFPVAAQQALKGVALVIGQSAYEEGSRLRPLRNPEADALDFRARLRELGFDVSPPVLDADADDLRDALADFARQATGADVALLYYSGHGIESGGRNFLVPVDADMSTPEAAGLSLVPLQDLLDELQLTAKVTILLFDACRTDSFPPGQMVLLPGDLVPVAVTPEGRGPEGPASKGTVLVAARGRDGLGAVVGFAASPGQAALDGDKNAHSPYAAALLKHFGAGGYGLADVMTLVTQEVYLETASRQLPWTNSSLTQFVGIGVPPEEADADEALIRDSRRQLLLTISSVPPATRRVLEDTAATRGVEIDILYGLLRSHAQGAEARGADLGALVEQGLDSLRAIEDEAFVAADPELRRLNELAERAIAEGALDAALAFRARATARAEDLSAGLEAVEDAIAAERAALASVYAGHASAALLNSQFLLAAEMFDRARQQVDRWDRQRAFTYLVQRGAALREAGYHTGDPKIIAQAFAAFESAQELASRKAAPLDWAAATFGVASTRTVASCPGGKFVGGASPAISAARRELEEVLSIWTRSSVPEKWALAQFWLARTLMCRGSGFDDTGEAEEAYNAAMAVWTPHASPLDWAYAMHELSMIHLGRARAARDPAERRRELESALAGVRSELAVRTRSLVPAQWADTQHDMASILLELGRPQEALAGFRLALDATSREEMPLYWQISYEALKSTLRRVAEHTRDAQSWLELASLVAIEASADGTAAEAVREAYGQAVAFLAEGGGYDAAATLVNESRAMFQSPATPPR
jgi:uncharacterized caspase-like protein